MILCLSTDSFHTGGTEKKFHTFSQFRTAHKNSLANSASISAQKKISAKSFLEAMQLPALQA
jgi:hypothetical protein